ncbi:hypothetical protein SLA2020_453090 [Shorea laevis]
MRPPVKITFPAFLDKEACFATVLDKRENPFYFMEGGVHGSQREVLEVDTIGEGGTWQCATQRRGYQEVAHGGFGELGGQWRGACVVKVNGDGRSSFHLRTKEGKDEKVEEEGGEKQRLLPPFASVMGG